MATDWEPTQNDIVWLKSLLTLMRIGTRWQSPLGYTLMKTGSRELTLEYIADLEDVWEKIERIKKTAKKAGIKIIIRGIEP